MNRSPLFFVPCAWLLLSCGQGDASVEPGAGGSGDAGTDAADALVPDAPADATGDEAPRDAFHEDGPAKDCTNLFEGLSPLSTCGWSGENGSPSAIWGSSANDIYVVGRYGYATHYDGVRWSRLDLGTTEDLRGVWGSSASNVFVTGSQWVYRFDGTSWGRQQLDGKGLRWVRGLSACEVFGHEEPGSLEFFDGQAWSDFPAPAPKYPVPWLFTDVAGSSSSDVYVTGYVLSPGAEGPVINSIISHYDGTSWTELLEVSAARLNAIWVGSPTNIYVAGGFDHAGLVLHYDGHGWETVAEPKAELTTLWGYSETDIYAAGFWGTVMHYDGTAWQQVVKDSRALRIEKVFGASDRLWFAAVNGVGYLDGGDLAFTYWWPNWTSLYALAGTSSAGLYAFGTLFGGYPAAPAGLRYDGEAWTWLDMPNMPGDCGLFGACSVSDDEVYAVGVNSTILHYDGATWTQLTAPESDIWLMTAWASGKNDVFVGGEYGRVFHFNGTQWSTMNSGAKEWIRGLSGTAPDNVFAVADDGVMHYDGSAWSKISDTGARAVWAAEKNDAFAGTQRDLLRYADGVWETVYKGSYSADLSFSALWGSSPSDVWAVGQNGGIVHLDGSQGETTTGLPRLDAVWGDGSGNLVAAGYPVILRYTCQSP
jgi:hypothetical protein